MSERNPGKYLLFLLMLLGSLTLRPSGAQAQQLTVQGPFFEDVTERAGIVAPIRQPGGERITGQAWGDFNQNGWLDLYLTDTNGPNVLYENNGDGTFTVSPLSEQVALPDAESAGAVFVDYDNDGWPDLYVVNWGPNVLYRNDEGRGFIDVTELAGVGDDSNGKTASWGDFDNDGYLDLYVANWSCSPRCGRPVEGDRDRLYRNNGDGTFSDYTAALGGRTRGAGFVASFVDFDNDGDLDIYLVNDEFINPIGNVLWRNDGPGCGAWCFTEVSAELNANTRLMGMGLAIADYNNNGYLDFYFSNAGPQVLLQNQAGAAFANVAAEAGVEHPQGIGWGAVFFDFDNDGWPDLYLAIMQSVTGGAGPNPLFRNEGDGTFTNLGQSSGAADPGQSIGVAFADFDQDGWVDLVVGNYDEGYRLYRNLGADLFDNNWITLKLVGGGAVNRDAVGTRVYLTDSNGRTQLQEVRAGSSLGSGDALELYFGLGTATVEQIEIRWPDGLIHVEGALPANQRYVLTYGDEPLQDVRDQVMELAAASDDSTSFLPALTSNQTLLPIAAVLLLALISLLAYGRLRRAASRE